MVKEFLHLSLRIAPDRIHFLRFILEGYDGMAVLTTLDARKGLVLLRFSEPVRPEVEELLAELAPQLGGCGLVKEIPED